MYKHFGYVQYSKGQKGPLAGPIMCEDGAHMWMANSTVLYTDRTREPLMAAAVTAQVWGVGMTRWRWRRVVQEMVLWVGGVATVFVNAK